MRVPFFRIFYSTTFTILLLILLAFLLVTPADCIYQAYKYDQLFNVFIIAGVYLLTAIIAILIYATRRYASKSHLASIPKLWMPIENGDFPIAVRKMIKDAFAKSASVAYEVHPRDIKRDSGALEEEGTRDTHGGDGRPTQLRAPKSPQQQGTTPRWGIISHPGWSSPSSPDLPHLQYDNVINELPHLIEAKAVSLAPPDPLYTDDNTNLTTSATLEAPPPDALAVELLQRPATMGLRDYFAHLTSIGMINPPKLGASFLQLYERARFSGQALDEQGFRNLMSMFAEILRNLREIDAVILNNLRSEEESDSEVDQDKDSITTTDTVEHTPFHTPFNSPEPDSGGHFGERPTLHKEASHGSLAGSEGTVRTPSRSHGKQREASRETRSTRSFGWRSTTSQPKRPRREPSRTSLWHVPTNDSSASSNKSRGSVIRLTEARTVLDLPYAFVDAAGDQGVGR